MPPSVREYTSTLSGRSMLVKKCSVLPVEAIVRGYISGSAWKEYKVSGTVHGIQMPSGLKECDKLERPLFTPSTKAPQGQHDENIHPDTRCISLCAVVTVVKEMIGAAKAKKVEELALQLYTKAASYAATKGIIIADTKFEFGETEAGEIILIDEVLTPDSSRFWPQDRYVAGQAQDSFDKQYLRDWLTRNSLAGSKDVTIPEDIVQETARKYKQVFRILTEVQWTE